MGDPERITKLEFSQTPGTDLPKAKGKGGRTRKAPAVGTWAVRGVDLETRSIIEKAATRAGKTMGQYVNEDIRGLIQQQLTQTHLPASPVDIQHQIDHLTRLVESLTDRMPDAGKRSLWQRLFS